MQLYCRDFKNTFMTVYKHYKTVKSDVLEFIYLIPQQLIKNINRLTDTKVILSPGCLSCCAVWRVSMVTLDVFSLNQPWGEIFHYFSSIHFRVADKLNVTSLHWSFFLFKNTSVSNILILLISVQWIHHPAVGNMSSTSRWTAGVTVRSCPTRRCYRDLHPADWNLNSTTWTQTWRSEQGVTFHHCHTKLHLTLTVF